MMKIIKKGIKPKPRIYRYKCPTCYCIFECEDEDFEEVPCPDLAGIAFYYLICPQCGERYEANPYIGRTK